MLTRVRECTSCQSPADQRPYVIPDPAPTTDAELVALVQDALSRNEACGFPEEEGPITVLRRPLTLSEAATRTAPLTEGLDDRYIRERGVVAQLLGEAVYALAASAAVRNYILTPTIMGPLRKIDPYQPQFELWKRGAEAVTTWGELGDGIAVTKRNP